jgi:hypothetical protein
MLDIQKIAIENLVAMLDKAGAQYKIILSDGTEFGALEVQTKKVIKRSPSLLPRGTLVNHYLPYIESLEVGDVACIPLPKSMDAESMRSSLSSWIHNKWGASSGTTMVTKRNKQIEVQVLRLK